MKLNKLRSAKEAMQDVDAFMADFFRARVLEERRYQESRAAYRRKFFAEDCRYDSHADTLRRLESERILNTNQNEPHARVITEQTFNYMSSARPIRFLYHLQRFDAGWIIRRVQTACYMCGGHGDANCPLCKGELWLDTGQKGVVRD